MRRNDIRKEERGSREYTRGGGWVDNAIQKLTFKRKEDMAFKIQLYVRIV
jgi:hypothetical protein